MHKALGAVLSAGQPPFLHTEALIHMEYSHSG